MIFLKEFGKLLIAVVLQSSILKLISIGPVVPDLVMIVLVSISLRRGPLVGLYCGLLIGLIQDVYLVETLGANALAKCIVGYAMGLLFDESFIKIMAATKVLILGIAIFFHDFIFALATGLRDQTGSFILERTLPTGMYTLLFGALIYFLLPQGERAEA